MAKRIRCRCPLCGMLVTIKQLGGEHEFEFKIQETGSRGRGKIYHIYREPNSVEGEAFLVFKLSLIQKLRDVADRLLDSVQGDKKEQVEAVEVGADYEAIVSPVEITPFVEYESPGLMETTQETEVTPQTRMEGEREWQGSADVEAKTVLEAKTQETVD